MTAQVYIIKALALEDDPDIGELMREKFIMHSIPHEVHEMQDTFLEAFHRTKPDLVFIDWNTPRMKQNGNQLASTIKGINRSCMVVMSTVNENFDDLHDFVYKIKGDYWLKKGPKFYTDLDLVIEQLIKEFKKRLEWEKEWHSYNEKLPEDRKILALNESD